VDQEVAGQEVVDQEVAGQEVVDQEVVGQEVKDQGVAGVEEENGQFKEVSEVQKENEQHEEIDGLSQRSQLTEERVQVQEVPQQYQEANEPQEVMSQLPREGNETNEQYQEIGTPRESSEGVRKLPPEPSASNTGVIAELSFRREGTESRDQMPTKQKQECDLTDDCKSEKKSTFDIPSDAEMEDDQSEEHTNRRTSISISTSSGELIMCGEEMETMPSTTPIPSMSNRQRKRQRIAALHSSGRLNYSNQTDGEMGRTNQQRSRSLTLGSSKSPSNAFNTSPPFKKPKQVMQKTGSTVLSTTDVPCSLDLSNKEMILSTVTTSVDVSSGDVDKGSPVQAKSPTSVNVSLTLGWSAKEEGSKEPANLQNPKIQKQSQKKKVLGKSQKKKKQNILRKAQSVNTTSTKKSAPMLKSPSKPPSGLSSKANIAVSSDKPAELSSRQPLPRSKKTLRGKKALKKLKSNSKSSAIHLESGTRMLPQSGHTGGTPIKSKKRLQKCQQILDADLNAVEIISKGK
jgi:hypothetical protein